MALIGKLVGATSWYTPLSERTRFYPNPAFDPKLPPEGENLPQKPDKPDDYQASRFLLRMLSAQELRTLKNLATGLVEALTTTVRVSGGSIVIETVRRALVGWENFLDEDGNAIPFKGSKGGKEAHDKDMDYLQWDLLEELCEEVMRMNETTATEKKALSSVPLSLSSTEPSSIASPAPPATATSEEKSGSPDPTPTSTEESQPDPATPPTS